MVEGGTPDDDDPSACLATADRLLREALSEGLRPVGLSWTDYQALRRVAHHHPPVSQLARELRTTVAVTVRLIDDLEQRGLVVRRPDEHDRRTKRVDPTGLGLSALREARAALATVSTELWAGRPAGESDELDHLLHGLIQRLKDGSRAPRKEA